MKLKELIDGKIVSLKLLQRDQYGRAVAIVTIPKFYFFKQDVSLKLLESGLAVVYRGIDASYGSKTNKDLYNSTESKARKSKRGIWSQRNFETPGQYKKIQKLLK